MSVNNYTSKGSLDLPKAMNFRKISERGGGGLFPIQKISLRFFCFLNANFGHDFPEKRQKKGGVISDPKNFVANLVRFGPVWKKKLQHFFPKKGRGGWGVKCRSEIFRKFISFGKYRLP